MVCERRRQEFIDCMFKYSRCAQSGRPLSHCISDSQDQQEMRERLGEEGGGECVARWRDWMRCRQGAVDPRNRLRGNRDL